MTNTLKGLSLAFFGSSGLFLFANQIFVGRAGSVFIIYGILFTVMWFCSTRFSEKTPDFSLEIGVAFLKEYKFVLAMVPILSWLALIISVLLYKEIYNIGRLIEFSPVTQFIKTYGVLAVVITFILSPAAEELFFRHFLFGNLANRLNPKTAAVVSSVLYGMYHLTFLLAFGQFIVGLLQCWLFLKAKNNLIVVISTNILLQVLLGVFAKI